MWIYLCRQHSAGKVEIASTDPRDPPLIDHGHLADRRDLERFADAWEHARALLASAPFARAGATWLDPTLDIATRVPATMASAHHQSGTCRMHPDPTLGVVDVGARPCTASTG